MTTEQIDEYLEYIQSVQEACKIERPDPYKYSDYYDDSDSD